MNCVSYDMNCMKRPFFIDYISIKPLLVTKKNLKYTDNNVSYDKLQLL